MRLVLIDRFNGYQSSKVGGYHLWMCNVVGWRSSQSQSFVCWCHLFSSLSTVIVHSHLYSYHSKGAGFTFNNYYWETPSNSIETIKFLQIHQTSTNFHAHNPMQPNPSNRSNPLIQSKVLSFQFLEKAPNHPFPFRMRRKQWKNRHMTNSRMCRHAPFKPTEPNICMWGDWWGRWRNQLCIF